MYSCNLVSWLIRVPPKFSVSIGMISLYSREGHFCFDKLYGLSPKNQTQSTIIKSTCLRFCCGILVRYNNRHLQILPYLDMYVYMQIFKITCLAQGQIWPHITLEEMFQIKLNGFFQRGQIIANLIKMNLINISSKFWAWLFTAKEATVLKRKINSPWLGLRGC